MNSLEIYFLRQTIPILSSTWYPKLGVCRLCSRYRQRYKVGPKKLILYFCRVNLHAVMCTQCLFLPSWLDGRRGCIQEYFL